MPTRLLVLLPLLFTAAALADGPADNVAEKVRPIPPTGIAIGKDDRAELNEKEEAFGKEIAELRQAVEGKPGLAALLPDVEIFHKAVRYALEHGEVYDPKELGEARKLIEQGRVRARELRDGKPAWTTATGLVVRGFRSRIDGSVQPYGLVVPASYRPDRPHRHRLDVWLHGRGETLTELNFLVGRQRSAGEFTPEHAFVLHPYGRYCNAFKLAGEVDVLEALAHASRHYPIDDRRVVLRGFSMGGAGCWHLAAHYPDRWVAAAPGAGFSETPQFLKVFQKETLTPSAFEKRLWRLYDCPGWVANFHNLPVVAYSGEKDVQKQAADVMAEAFTAAGLDLVHLVGPGTGHAYHPRTREEINRRIDRVAERGRARVPPRVRFVTYSLRYDRSFWVRLDGLERHWARAGIDAELTATGHAVRVKTKNVSAFTLTFGPGDCPVTFPTPPTVSIDGTRVEAPPVRSDHSWFASFVKTPEGWVRGPSKAPGLRKRHGSQGPIDDAFLDSFLVVRPTGEPMHGRTGAWVKGEMAHALDQWRKQFRGEARVKDDTAVTADDLAAHNLILWGDPASNALIKKVLGRLPLTWDAREITLGERTWGSGGHVPLLVYPNPLNPQRYVVLNSGFTMREYDQLNNARQVPKLPDWAVVDVSVPPSSRWPGKVVAADFFDEAWKVRAR